MMNTFNTSTNKNRVIDYIGDDLVGNKPSYSSNEIAKSFSLVTGKEYSNSDIQRQFGKSNITDADLYQMVDLNGKADGYLTASEIKKFMSSTPAKSGDATADNNSFSYLEDGKTEYSLKEVSDKIANSTGKRVLEADLKKLMGGKETINDFEMMLLFDTQPRDGRISSSEMNDLISDFKINYSTESNTGNTDTPYKDMKQTLYKGDGKWDYTKDEFKKKMKDDLGINLSDNDIKKLFGDSQINDRNIQRMLDINNDGNIADKELNFSLNDYKLPTNNKFDYLSDNKNAYTKSEAMSELSKLLQTPMTDAQFSKLFGDKTKVSDADLLTVIDKFSPNGSINTTDLNSAIAQPKVTIEFDYLSDSKQSYTAEDLAKLISQDTGVNITAQNISDFFGKDMITDSEILGLDTKSLNGKIDGEEVGNLI